MDDVQRHHEGLRAAYLDARDALVEVLVHRIGEAVREHVPDATQVELESHRLDDGRLALEAIAIHSAGAPVWGNSADQRSHLTALIEPLLQELGELSPPEEVAQIAL